MPSAKMIKYVALLRGINVGGNRIIKMKELAAVLTDAGFRNVRTFIASGNVFFEAPTTDRAQLARKIERQVLKGFGHEIAVIVRTLEELKKVVNRNPFKRIDSAADVMKFVVLLASEPTPKPKLPLRSETENLEVVALTHGAAFIVARRKKTGWFAFPNNFIEKEFGVAATTRNYSTLVRMLATAD